MAQYTIKIEANTVKELLRKLHQEVERCEGMLDKREVELISNQRTCDICFSPAEEKKGITNGRAWRGIFCMTVR